MENVLPHGQSFEDKDERKNQRQLGLHRNRLGYCRDPTRPPSLRDNSRHRYSRIPSETRLARYIDSRSRRLRDPRFEEATSYLVDRFIISVMYRIGAFGYYRNDSSRFHSGAAFALGIWNFL